MENIESENEADKRHSLQNRLRADVHRAVGGAMNLLRELGRISQQLEKDVQHEWMMKRLAFFAWELAALVPADTSEEARLAILNRFFFKEKAFSCTTDGSRLSNPSGNYQLGRVLLERKGAPSLIAILYAYLAERLDITLELIDLKTVCLLKWSDRGVSRYIDITRSGLVLAGDELLNLLHEEATGPRAGADRVLESHSFESYLTGYIRELKAVLVPTSDPQVLLFLQNLLISYQPSQLILLGERALLHRRLGNFKSALNDLKRYFAFHDRASAPAELIKLYEDLVLLLERHKANIDLVE
jgi:regulator of sirC expression with transglutaminase-like and TPR domain